MFVATLLCNPKTPHLAASLVRRIATNWSGGGVRVLADQVAYEFDLAAEPADKWAIWQQLQTQGIDLLLQPAQGRRKRLLLADMDSTMIEQECIDELAAEVGVGARVAAITARAMNGELDFEAALRERVGLMAGMDVAVISRVLATRISLMPGAAVLVATMKANGAYAALVSGGFTAFSEAIGARLGFDESRANVFVTRQGRLIGEVAAPVLGREAKVQALHEITARLGLTPDQAMAVGDGANDLGMLKLAGSGVALHAKPRVAAECGLRVNFGDLTALLYLQGYEFEEFALPDYPADLS